MCIRKQLMYKLLSAYLPNSMGVLELELVDLCLFDWLVKVCFEGGQSVELVNTFTKIALWYIAHPFPQGDGHHTRRLLKCLWRQKNEWKFSHLYCPINEETDLGITLLLQLVPTFTEATFQELWNLNYFSPTSFNSFCLSIVFCLFVCFFIPLHILFASTRPLFFL